MRTAVLAGIFLIALGAYVSTAPPEAELSPRRTPSMLPCGPQDVESIRIEGRGISVTGHRSVDGWKVSGAGADRWTAKALDDIAKAICDLPVLDRVEMSASGDSYGLSEPVARLRVRLGDAVRRVRVGDLSPAGTRAYVRVDDADDVLVVGALLRSELDKLVSEP